MTDRQVLMLSGGSEIISAALAEEFLANNMKLTIVAFNRWSILKGLAKQIEFYHINWPPEDPAACAEKLVVLVRQASCCESPLPVFATEDGGLRLLFEYRQCFEPIMTFSQAIALKMGGLDKAELFSFLREKGGEKIVSGFSVTQQVQEALDAVDAFGGDAVIKPALKPFSMTIPGLKGKAVFSKRYSNRAQLEKVLTAIWPNADRWLVQKRLRIPQTGEISVWAIRDRHGKCYLMAARNRWKYPREGGTGCWVRVEEAKDNDSLFLTAKRTLEILNFVGMCEMEFLLNDDDSWKLVELNPRPWLQVGLAFRVGVPLATATTRVLRGEELIDLPRPRSGDWINLERLLLAAISGEQGSIVSASLQALRLWRKANVVAVHDSRLAGVRWRWLRNMFLHLWS